MAKEWKEDEGGDFDESQEDKRKDQNTQKPIGQEELLNEAKNFFQGNRKEVGQAAKRGEKIVHVNFEDLSEDSPLLAENIILKPEETVQLLELALEESGMISNARVRLINLAKTQEVKIRNIRAKHLGTMISVEGIVRQASEVRPRVVNAKFECPSCGSIISVLQLDNKFREPSRCSCGRRGGFKELSKDMVDAQGLKLEESPDSLSGGEQPKRMQIFLKEDLVEPKMEERTTPGSKVKVIGVLKEVPLLTSTGGIQTKFDLAVEANNIIPMEETFEDINISEEDERTIKELAANPKVMQKIVQSIAPSIWGHEEVKKALTLQMFGGVRKVMTDGTKKRGDVHILLVGDPGVAKSVMLKFIAGIAPKGRYVSGKSTSGAGLTATVVKDEFLRGWALEAGALVLSNKGLVAIDELEKMDENDRSTMHEAMEQQCMLPDFKLMLSNGRYVNIGEFVDNLMEKNKEIVIKGKDCEILNVKEVDLLSTDFRSHFNFPASKVSRHKAPEYFTKIELTNGREIIVTPEHPCWVVKDAKIETISAEQLKRGDFFPVPSRVNINSLEYKRENDLLCKIIGYHISDGSYELNRGKKTGIQFWNNDKNLIDDYFNTIKAYFKVNPTITTRKNQFAVRVISKEVKSKILGLDKNLMEKGDKKIIPYSLMSLPNENLKYLLRALFDGDGSVIFVKRNGARVSLVCENKELAEQVADLLLRFEIQSSIVYDKSSRVYRLGITGKYNLLNFMNSIEFLSVKKMSRLKQYCSKEISYKTIRDLIPNCTNKINQIFKELKINVKKELGHQIDLCVEKQRVFLQKLVTIAKSNLMNENLKYHHLYQDLEELDRLAFGYARWIKIKKVSKVKNKDITWVYDVTIPPYKTFISNGMILHNTITISKANVQATLNSQTSILAAANPKFGRFDPTQMIAKQVDLAPSLLNRFDVIFILKDMPNRSRDESIATHVLQGHKEEQKHDIIEKDLLKKYVAYARQRINPVLSDEAVSEIKTFYVELRNKPTFNDSPIKPIPISARQLEALVRLSEALARAKLSKKVTREDAKEAIELVKYYLMQVGFDEETKTFDIDKISGNPASARSKIKVVLERIEKLESRLGKLIPIEELQKEIGDDMKELELEEAVEKLVRSGDLFKPRKGFIQRM